MMKLKYLLFCLLVCGGVMTSSAREFPLCVYSVSKPEDVAVAKKAGFTCVQSYTLEPEVLSQLAKAAQKEGLKTIFYSRNVLGSAYEKEAASWPVLAWYIVDEPDVAKWSRARVQELERKTKNRWPQHATSLVIGQGRTQTPYYDLTDVMMVDWYPVPHLPLTSLGDQVRWTKQGMQAYGTGDRPLWAVVQLFDWKEFKQYRPDNDRIGRLPTKEELRFMSYDAIANGASGLFYFHFTHYDKTLAEAQPEFWKQTSLLLKELNKFRPVLEKGKFLGQAANVTYPLVLQAWKYKGHTYYLLLNRSEVGQPAPAELLATSYKPIFKTKKARQVPPWGIWILKR